MQSPQGIGIPPALGVARILGIALAASVVLYGILSMVLRDASGEPDLPGAIHAALHVMAGLMVIAGVWLFRRMEAPRSGGDVGSADLTHSRRPPALPVRMVLGWALFEAVGVLGLVVSLLGGNGQVLVLVSLLLILLYPPRLEWFPPG